MDKVRLFSDRHFGKGCILALGTFDGVHKGHRELLNKALDLGRQLNLSTGVFFFCYPPAKYFSNNFAGVLTLPSEKEKIMSDIGLDFIIEADFEEYSNLSSDEFINVLTDKYNCQGVVCGNNFTFGKNRTGNFNMLEEKFGKSFVCLDLHNEGNVPVSSSEIRTKISLGDVKSAGELLGYNYYISGNVVHGREDGRKIGFPTANIIPDADKVIPGKGVYVTYTEIDCIKYKSITDIGNAPTLTSSTKTVVETHIPDFSNDIYGKNIVVHFVDKIRDEIKFESVEKLIEQMKKDVEFAKKSI